MASRRRLHGTALSGRLRIRVRRGEQAADAGCFGLLRAPLLVGIDRYWPGLSLSRDHRPAEIAGQRRAERRRLARDSCIVAWQAGKTIGDRVSFRRVELLRHRTEQAVALEGPEQSRADDDQGDGSSSDEDSAGQAGRAGSACTQAQAQS